MCEPPNPSFVCSLVHAVADAHHDVLHRMRLEVRCFLGFARVAMPAQGHARCTAVTANTGYRVSATHMYYHKNIGDPQAAADGGRRDSYS